MDKLTFFWIILCLPAIYGVQTTDEAEFEEQTHTIDSVQLIIFMGLLILTIISIWVIKHFRLRFIHETGLSIIYGMYFVFIYDCYNF